MNGGSVSTQAAAESTTPSGNATVTATNASTTTGGVFGYSASSDGKLYIQTSSNNGNGVNQAAIAVNTTGLTSIVLSYTIDVINASPRTIGVVAQYRVGTSGSWTTLTASSGSNPFSQAGGTTGLKTTVSATLPSAANNQSVVQVRWATWRGTETGNSSGIGIDNISVTGTAAATPTITGAATATAFTTTYGTASAAQTFAVSGSNLTANLVATAPTGFEVSSDGTTYGSTATFTQTSGSASGSLRIRLAANAAVSGTYNSQNIVLSSTGASSVNITTASSGNSVSQKALTITGASATNRAYNASTTVAVSGGSLVGVESGDSANVTLGGSPTGTVATATVGDGKAVTVTGYSISGSASGNYSLTQPTGLTVNITQKALTITGASATNRAYNATTTVAVSGGSLVGVESGDTANVTLSAASATGTVATADVGNSKAVTVTGYSISGSASGNYSLTQPTGLTVNITQKALTITGASATNRAYDASTTVAVSGGSLVGVESGDTANVTLGGSPTGTVATATVGDGKAVTVTGYSISGSASGNYSLSQPTGLTVNITKATPSITAAPTASAINFGQTLASSNLSGGTASVAGSFAFTTPSTAPGVGTASQDVTFTPTDTTNYNTASTSVSVTVNAVAPGAPTLGAITAGDGQLSVAFTAPASDGGAAITDYEYSTNDGSSYTSANTTTSPIVITGLDNGTTYTIRIKAVNSVGASAASNSGSGTPVVSGSPSISVSSLAGGALSTTYGTASSADTFTASGEDLTGNLSVVPPAGFEVSTSSGSGYTTNLTLTESSGVVSNTTVYVRLASSTGAGSYDGNIVVSGGGASSKNVTTTASTVSPKGLTIGGLSATNRVYNATNTGTVSGDAVYVGLTNSESFNVTNVVTWSFANKNVGTNKSLTASTNYTAPSANYTVTQPTFTANITAAELTVTGATAQNKSYNANTTATITGATLNGVISGDFVDLTGGTSGTFASANVGTNISVTTSMGISGTDSGNYSLTQPTGLSADITAVGLTITGISISNKVYDGNTNATISGTAAYSGLVGGQTFSVTGTPSASFATKTVANNKSVTVSGYTAPSANYSITQPTGLTANITAAPLTITGVTASNKVYDGNTTATLNTGSAALSGVVVGDTVNLDSTSATGSFANKTVANGKTVTTSGFSISGTDSGNYSLTQPTTTANITAAGLTVTGASVTTKAFDGNTTATITGATLSGVISPDDVTLTNATSGTFASANVGTNISVTTAMGITGTDSTNYSLTQPTLTGTITQGSQTITFNLATNTVTAGTTNALTGTASSGLTVSYTSANTNVASISGTNVIAVAAGVTTITASQGGNSNVTAATPVSRTLNVSGAANLGTPTSTQNFGTTAATNTSQTASTSTITNPTSGTTYARAGQTVPNAPIIVATNTPNPLGATGAYLRAVASDGASVSKASPIVGYTGGTEFYTTFKVRFGDSSASTNATSGSWSFYQGAGGNYSDNVAVTAAQTAVGLRFTYGTGGSVALSFMNTSGSFVTNSLSATTFSQGSVHTVEIVCFNGASGTDTYTYNGVTKTLNAGNFDLYINGTQVASNLASGFMNLGATINSATFTGINSTGNVANLFVDDFVVYNAIPSSIGTVPAITPSGTFPALVTTYGTASSNNSVLVSGGGLTSNITATPPTGFEVSTNGSTWSSNATFTQTSGFADGTLFLRLNSNSAAGSYTNLAVSLVAGSVSNSIAISNSTVNRYPITVGAVATNKVYGAADPALTYTNAPLLFSDTFSGSIARAAGNNAGTYAITQGTLTNANYDITFLTNTFTIDPRALTITANNATKVAGTTLTTPQTGSTAFSSSGLASGDSISSVTITYTDGAASDAPAGLYSNVVVPSAPVGINTNNYSITFNAGNLTVDASPTIVVGTASLSAFSTTYGTDSANQNFTVSGGSLPGATITVAAPSGFQVSTNASSGFVSSLNLDVVANAVPLTTIYARVPGTTGASTNLSGNIAVSSDGATTQNVAIPTSAVAPKGLTIGGLSATNRVYDATTNGTVSGTPVYVGLTNSQTFPVTNSVTWAFANKNVGTNKALAASASFTAPSDNYTVSSQPTFSANITQATLTLSNAAATSRAYAAGNTNVTITGTLNGVFAGDIVGFSGTGTIASPNAGTNIPVTSTVTLTGADAGNYTLTQPTGLTVDITKASNTITFGALSNVTVGTTNGLAATATSGLAVTYTSSNTNVATISGTNVIAVAPGVTTITANQSGNENFDAATPVSQTLNVQGAAGASQILGIHDFETVNASPALTRSTATVSGSPATSAISSGNSASSGDSPANSPLFAAGSQGYRASGPNSGSTAAIVASTFSSVDTRNYASVSVSVRVAAFSIGSTGNGMEATDYCEISVSPDGGTTWYQQHRLTGNTNARWAFSGTGSATRAYQANNTFTTTSAPSSGLLTGDNAITTLLVTGLPSVADLRVRVTTSCNDVTENWVIDNVTVTGSPLTPAITPSGSFLSVSTTYGTASAASASTVAVSGGSLTSNITATAPTGFEVSTNGSIWSTSATFTQSNGFAIGDLYLRLAATANAGTYSNQTVSLTAGSASNSVAIATSTVSPGVLASNQITLTPVGDGSYSASGPEGSTFGIAYSGRTANGITTTYSSAAPPTAPGYYTATANATGNYTGSNSSNYFIAGPILANDTVSKIAGESAFIIEGSSLLANDRRIDSAGAVQTTGLSIASAVAGGETHNVLLDGTDILFEVASGTSPWTFTYSVTNDGKTATGTVTVSDGAVEQPFQLQIVRIGSVTFNGTDTTQQVEFIGVPNTTLLVETTTNLISGPWTSTGNQSTGATGSFTVTLSASGNQVATWPTGRFFRARLVTP